MAFGLLGAAAVMWLAGIGAELRVKIVVLAFIVAIAGIGAGAVALREPWLRRAGRRGLVLSVAAALCALAIGPVFSALR